MMTAARCSDCYVPAHDGSSMLGLLWWKEHDHNSMLEPS